MKVFVYFNLHKKVWSIKAMEGEQKGRVIAHAENVYLKDAMPKVSEAGRQRVLKEKRKNVHAGIVGELLDDIHAMCELASGEESTLYYNPYKVRTFVQLGEPEKAFSNAPMVHLDATGRHPSVAAFGGQFAKAA